MLRRNLKDSRAYSKKRTMQEPMPCIVRFGGAVVAGGILTGPF